MAKKKAKSKADSQGKQPSRGGVDFEEALAEAEGVVKKLESGELGLAESLRQYELGIKRIKQCHQSLQAAQRRISLLSGITEDGEAILEPFGGDTSAEGNPGSELSEWDADAEDEWDDDEDSVDESPGLF